MVGAERKMRSDPAFKAGVAKIDRDKLRGLAGSLEMDFASGMAFHNVVEHATALKAKNGELAADAERQIARAGRDAVRASRHAVKTLKQANRMLSSAKLDKVVEEYAPSIFREYDKSPGEVPSIRTLTRLGMHDDALQCARRDLAKVKFNPFRIEGADGTFAGLAAAAESGLPRLEKLVKITADHGLPTVRGRNSGNPTADAVVTTIIILGAAGIILAIIFVP
jgi:hypothetical protein